MINVIDADESIEIKETLSFKYHVQPIFDDILENLKYDLEDYAEEDKQQIQEFLNYELTHEDKIEILDDIVYAYQVNGEYVETASIFDKDSIESVVKEWITDNFDFEF